MTPEQYHRAGAIFDEACALPEPERAAFVHEQSADDEVVHRKVMSMLQLDSRATDAIDTPALGRGFHVGQILDGQEQPDRIGSFHVVELVGEGGMGRVYRCTQEHPQRTVAVKLLRPGMMGPAGLRRFRHETEMLGRLQHAGIAQIHEAGTFDSGNGAQPYFVMEFVEGSSLVRFADREALDVRARMALFVRVCDAVHHAHQRGIIHRDLKPDNILVEASGQPKILDFGVARITDTDVQATLHTTTGQLIGTLQYMSPEQCDADPHDIDVRSDVYAMGIILYELLCGRRPYDVSKLPIHDAVRLIQESSAPRLSTIDRRLRGDLETIALKALEKDRARRYQSASELGQDVQRFLDDEPILARPPSALYQIGKFARRHRAATVAGIAVVVVLVLGIAASTTFAIREASARADAEAAGAESLRRAEELVLINDFLKRMLEQADPWKSGGTVTIATALERASGILDESFGAQPAIEATVRETIGDTYLGLGLYAESMVHFAQAVDIHRTLFGANDPRTLRGEMLVAKAELAAGRIDVAVATLEPALAIATEQLGPDDALTLTMNALLAQLFHRQGRWNDSDRILRHVVAARERTLGPDHGDTITVLEMLAWNCLRLGQIDEAEDAFERVCERHAAIEGEDSPRRMTCLNGLANAAYDRLDYDEAERLSREALALSRRVFGSAHPETAVALAGLANALSAMGRRDEAEPFGREAAEIYQDALGPDHAFTLVARNNLGAVLAHLGRFDDAERILVENLEMRRRVVGDDHPDVAHAWDSLGLLAYRREDWGRAIECYTTAVAVYRRSFGDDLPIDAITSLVNLGTVLNRAERYDEAVEALRPVVDFDRASLANDHPVLAGDLVLYARALEGAGRIDEATEIVREAIEVYERGDDTERRAEAEEHLARLRGTQGP